MLLLKDLESIFLYSTMFDVFCVKISLVCVKYFVHKIGLKESKYLWLKLDLSFFHQKLFPLIFDEFELQILK